MLLVRKHWHDASERDPSREARLLCFANGNTPSGGAGTPGTPDPAQTHTTYAAAGLNPDGTPVAPGTANAAEAQAAGGAAAQTQETRAAIADALAGGSAESVEEVQETLKPAEVAQGFETMVKHLDAIREYRRDRRLTGWMKSNLSPEDYNASLEALHLVEAQHGVAAELHDTASRLAEWKGGQLTPDAFRASLDRSLANHPRRDQILSSFDAAASSPALAPIVAQWNADGNVAQESDKQMVIQGIWDAIGGDELLEEMQSYLSTWEKHVTKVEELIRPKQEAEEAQKDRPQLSIMERIRDIRRKGIGGVGFYSPLEWWEATKKIYQSFKDARQEDLDLMSNKLAVSITGALEKLHVPYGEAVNRRFSSTAEADFNKKKNEYKEELGDDNFRVLIDKFHAVRRDPPRAIAVLEVAAGHGWVYDIADLGDERWPIYVFGEEFSSLTPSHWDEDQMKNYLGTLRRQNTEGGNAERKKGHERTISQTDPEVFIRRFNAYIDDHNYWQAMGVMDAMIDRGKMAEVSEFFTAKMIHHFRTYPDAMRYMPRPVLEQFGNTKWNSATTWANNMVTMNLSQVEELRKDPTAMKGPLLGTLDMLEREIRDAAQGTMTDEQILREVGKALSGQLVTINGRPISVYTEKYRQYWDETKNNVFGTYKPEQFIKEISTDYYTDASILQLPSGTVQALFDTGSTGQFSTSNLPLLQNYVGYALKHLVKLRESGHEEAARTFEGHIASKIENALEKAFTDRAANHLHKYQVKMGNEIGNPIIASLIEAGLISEEKVFSYVERLPGADEFKSHIRRQRQDIRRKGLLHTVNSGPPAQKGPPSGAPGA